jgi:hypothetical protein
MIVSHPIAMRIMVTTIDMILKRVIFIPYLESYLTGLPVLGSEPKTAITCQIDTFKRQRKQY